MLILQNEHVAQVLDMSVALEALEIGLLDYARGDGSDRAHIPMWMPSEREDGYYRMQDNGGATRTYGIHAFRIMSDVLYWPRGERAAKYAARPGNYCSLTYLFSTQNAAPLAIMQDGLLQHYRTAGSAVIGAKYLARQDARRVGMIGSGGMARCYLEGFALVRRIEEVRVFSPTVANRDAFALEMSEKLGIAVSPVGSVGEAVSEADIVAMCTNALGPVITDVSSIKPGMHITNCGMGEINPELMRRADLRFQMGSRWGRWIEQPPQYFHAMVGRPEETARIRSTDANPAIMEIVHQLPSLVDVMAGTVPGRSDDTQVTFYLTNGLAGVQFAALCAKVYELARAYGLGHEVPTEWFTQDIRD